MRFWGLIPARGGSKSIPLKNLAALGGRPLIDYVILAGQSWNGLERLVCSTDAPVIARRAGELGVEVDRRPAQLAGDETPVAEVARDFLGRGDPVHLPDWLILLQPTSPFVLVEHLEALAQAVRGVPDANSAQTVVPVPHNHHAWNQRVLENGRVRFAMAEERARGYNKQLKPKHHVFGNLVAVRVAALMGGADFFAPPSAAVVIEPPYDIDVDAPQDLAIAEALLAHGLARLDHLSK
jgi:CMP-N-acetylneuraminic acid synthetase